MFPKFLAVTILGVASIGIQPALADPKIKSDEIVDYFVKAEKLGAARGICIGTEEECDKTAPKPAGLDMLINFDLDSANLTPQAQQISTSLPRRFTATGLRTPVLSSRATRMPGGPMRTISACRNAGPRR